MELLVAIQIVEGDKESSEEQCVAAWQWLIDQGHVWSLQGWYGRTAVQLIEDGVCTPAFANR